MILRVRLSSIRYVSIVLFIWGLSVIINSTFPANDIGVRMATILQFGVFMVLYVALGKAQGELLSLYAIWMIAFYVFQNGQLLLYAFGFDYDYWYVEKYSKTLMFEAVCISTNCLCAAFAAGGFAFERERFSTFMQRMNAMDEGIVLKGAKVGWVITGLVAYANLLIKLGIVTSSGYRGVLIYEATVPSFIGLIEYYFPVFSIMLITYINSGRYVNGVVVLYLLWGILTALTGDRTIGIATVVIVAVMYLKNVYSFQRTQMRLNEKKRWHWGRVAVFVIIAIICMYLTAFAFSFRVGDQYEGFGLSEIVIRTIGELGFSYFPLVLNMQIYPSIEPYLQGKSLIASMICGFFPRTIDFAGITANLADLASAPMRKIEEYYDYTFGIDCSLIAEGYANFGSSAWIAVFICCCVVATMLKKVDYRRKDNRFAQYLGLALLFVWFTIPRRRSYYIYNHMFWICIVMSLFLKLVHDYLVRINHRIKD